MPTFYEIDSVRTSIRENWWGSKNNPLTFLLAMILKVVRKRYPFASDDANANSTLPLIVDELPPAVAQRFEPMAAELAGLGFLDPVYHAMHDPGGQIRIYWATFRHATGQYCARIHNRYWDRTAKGERAFFPMFFTFFGDGSFLLSSSGKPDTAEPPTVEMIRQPGVTLAKLWDSHTRLVDQRCQQKPIRMLDDRNAVICASEHLHGRQCDFHLGRGFFRERTAKEAEQAQEFTARVDQVRAEGSQYPEIIAEIIRLEEKKPRWSKSFWLLGISLIAFVVGASATGWKWENTLWLIPILLFHESGHWLAMRIFGYRNLQMFFIPLFGAAASGQHRNVPGWKKAVVSLAGPLPGIALGLVLTIVALVTHSSWLNKATYLLLFINIFNLLPIFPLDGGRFVQYTLFCRNRWLDIIFRVVAIAALILLTVAGISRTLMYVGIALAVGLPMAFKTAKITDYFRRNPLPPTPPDQDRIPRPAAEALIGAVKNEMPKAGNGVVAQMVLNIYETLNARPPGFFATTGLMALYGGAIVVGVVTTGVLLVGGTGAFGMLANALAGPKHDVARASTELWRGADASRHDTTSHQCVVSTFAKNVDARKAYEDSVSTLPSEATALQFGDSVIISLPRNETATGKQWSARLLAQTANTFLATNNSIALSLSFYAPTLTASSNIENMLQEYFVPGMTNLVPPWNPMIETPEFADHLAARHAYYHLTKVWADTYSDPEVGTASQPIAPKDLTTNPLAQLLLTRQKAAHHVQEKAHQRLKAEYAGTAYSSLVDYYWELEDGAVTNKEERAEITAKLADRLGCFTSGGGVLLMPGVAMQRRLNVRVPFLSLNAPETNLSQLIQWLTQQGCTRIRYDIGPFDSDGVYIDPNDEN